MGCSWVPSPALITCAVRTDPGRELLRRTGRRVPADHGVGAHGLQGPRGVLERFALGDRRALGREVDHVRGQPLGGQLERDPGAGGVLEEQVDHGAAAQRGQLAHLAAGDGLLDPCQHVLARCRGRRRKQVPRRGVEVGRADEQVPSCRVIAPPAGRRGARRCATAQPRRCRSRRSRPGARTSSPKAVGNVLADVVGADRQLPVPAVDQDGELDDGGPAVVAQRVERRPDRPPGDTARRRPGSPSRRRPALRDLGRLQRARRVPAQVVAVERDVQGADRHGRPVNAATPRPAGGRGRRRGSGCRAGRPAVAVASRIWWAIRSTVRAMSARTGSRRGSGRRRRVRAPRSAAAGSPPTRDGRRNRTGAGRSRARSRHRDLLSRLTGRSLKDVAGCSRLPDAARAESRVGRRGPGLERATDATATRRQRRSRRAAVTRQSVSRSVDGHVPTRHERRLAPTTAWRLLCVYNAVVRVQPRALLDRGARMSHGLCACAGRAAARHPGQQGLSLHGVEEKSEGRWKAVVVGSYERGDRAVTVAKLAELAEFYGVPVAELLPDARAARRGAPAPNSSSTCSGWPNCRPTRPARSPGTPRRSSRSAATTTARC